MRAAMRRGRNGAAKEAGDGIRAWLYLRPVEACAAALRAPAVACAPEQPILDELPTLHQVPSLQPGIAESRRFGGCFVLGVQVASVSAMGFRRTTWTQSRFENGFGREPVLFHKPLQ